MPKSFTCLVWVGRQPYPGGMPLLDTSFLHSDLNDFSHNFVHLHDIDKIFMALNSELYCFWKVSI